MLRPPYCNPLFSAGFASGDNAREAKQGRTTLASPNTNYKLARKERQLSWQCSGDGESYRIAPRTTGRLFLQQHFRSLPEFKPIGSECPLLSPIACCPESLQIARCFKHYGCATVWRY